MSPVSRRELFWALMAAAALAAYRKAQSEGHGSLDYSAVFLSVRDERSD